MLNPSPIVDSIVATLKLIPPFALAMTDPLSSTVRINSFHYLQGKENRLIEAVYKMQAPSTLFCWEATLPGNFNGYTIWKHRFGLYMRMGNGSASSPAVGYETLWYYLCDSLPTGSNVNIRYMNLYPGLDIMDTPSIVHQLDEDSIDIFKVTFVIPEIGDN